MIDWERVTQWALGPMPAASLERFRFAAALVLMIYTLTWALDAREWLTDVGYHPSAAVTHGLQLPVPLLGPLTLVPFLLIYVGAMAAIVLGWRARACSIVVLGGLSYVTVADRLAAFSINKLALVAWLVLILAPWGEGERDTHLRSAWPVRVLQGTLLLQYFGAGICKLRGGWLVEPRALWLQVQDVYLTEFAAWLVRELPLWAWTAMQHATLVFELLAPMLFCTRRLRPLAFAWGLAMHLVIGLTMYRVGLFSLSVVAYYLLFTLPERANEDRVGRRVISRTRAARKANFC